jgi:NAD(P)-dependent dehydrogenase (short-subunit alcohol dehydrogenase family)
LTDAFAIAQADGESHLAPTIPGGPVKLLEDKVVLISGGSQVDEIADFVVFLLSDRSGVVTGSVIDWDQNVLGGLD